MPKDKKYKQVNDHEWNSEKEVADLLAALINCTGATKVLELGVFHGFTAAKMIDALPVDGYYAGIDIEDLRETKHKTRGKIVEFIKGSSTDLSIYPQEKFDLIFVDSMHHWSHILTEWKIVENMIAEGGVIAYHDTIHMEDLKRLMTYIASFNFNMITLPTTDNRGLTLITKKL